MFPVSSSVLSLQKHIKEHHEEVRERPCPHPGCNKVFMIDRYLQRHVKLIHTGVCQQLTDTQGLLPPWLGVLRLWGWGDRTPCVPVSREQTAV